MSTLELKIPPLALTLIIGGIMVALSRHLPSIDLGVGVGPALSVICALLGAYFCLFGVWEFRKSKTTVDPRHPEKSSSLVDSGVYAISRNPMYLGFGLFLLSLVFLLGSPYLLPGVVAFVLYMNRFQIKPEEAYLSTVFGQEYIGYMHRVRRWL